MQVFNPQSLGEPFRAQILKKKSHSLKQENSARRLRKSTEDSSDFPQILVNQKSIFQPEHCDCSATRQRRGSESSEGSEYSFQKSEDKAGNKETSVSSGHRTMVSSSRRFKGDFRAKLNESQTKLKNLKLNLNLKKRAKEKLPKKQKQPQSMFRNMLSKMFNLAKITLRETTDSETSFHSKSISLKSDSSIFSEKGETSLPPASVRREPSWRLKLPSRVKMIRAKLKKVGELIKGDDVDVGRDIIVFIRIGIFLAIN